MNTTANVAAAPIRATFVAARKEVEQQLNMKRVYVACDDGLSPLRVNRSGYALFGGRVFLAMTRNYAETVAARFQEAADAKDAKLQMQVMRADKWAAARIAQIDGWIAQLDANA